MKRQHDIITLLLYNTLHILYMHFIILLLENDFSHSEENGGKASNDIFVSKYSGYCFHSSFIGLNNL
jgi:hypothetical protein